MTTKMNYFDYDLVETYYANSLLNGDCWMFISHGNELRKPESINSSKTSSAFLEKAIAGIRLYPQDYAFMIPIRPWQQNTAYTEYDDEVDIKNLPYFVAVDPEIESGNYHIFKCISNNYNTQSTEKPTFNQNIVSGIYEGGDGYVWKYMASVPYLEYRKFSAKGFMPVFRNSLVEAESNTGIYNIKVQNRNTNFGYELLSGKVDSFDVNTNTVFLKSVKRLSGSDETVSDDQTLNFPINDFYADRSFQINSSMSNSIIGSRLYKIQRSGTTNNGVPFVRLDSVTDISIEDSFEILPEIIIKGDGTGAAARCIFENDRITSIRMTAYGNGYKNATCYIVPPRFGFSSDMGDIEALLRPIISPAGGHGSNVIRELNSKAISVAALVASKEGSKVPATGKYSKIGLVKSPVFKQSEVFTKRTSAIIQQNVNQILLENVAGIVPGMSVIFNDSIPSKTLVTSVDTILNKIFISANTTNSIPQLSSIQFSSVIGSFDNRIKIIATENIPGELQPGEIVTQGNIRAVIHSIDFVNKEIYLIEYAQDFSNIIVASQPIVTRLGSIGINTIEYSPYEQKTGEVLYVSDITPIARESDRVEQLRVIIQF